MSKLDTVFEIEHAGPFVSVQDRGRFGYERFGVTQSGPMDRTSHALANFALGKDDGASAIEISPGGLVINCIEGEITMAVAGGCFDIVLDSTTQAPWSVFTVKAGSQLKIRPGSWGSWAYLAFVGKISAPTWLESQSVHLNSGLCGLPFSSGDRLVIKNASVLSDKSGSFFDPDKLKPDDKIHIVLGPQDKYFDEKSISSLELTEYKLTSEYDRMGVRLKGTPLKINRALDMPSEAIARGSLQVPGHGDPICLLADHQTTGGYPKIATVISADQDKLVQMRVGDSFRFEKISVEEAIEIARNRNAQIDMIKAEIENNQTGLINKLWANNLISGVVGSSEPE